MENEGDYDDNEYFDDRWSLSTQHKQILFN
jgi:hypothetical protein